jgi:outer membrane protein assembly factor BamA
VLNLLLHSASSQVGDDAEAGESLAKLDDDLKSKVRVANTSSSSPRNSVSDSLNQYGLSRDIVDTTMWPTKGNLSSEELLKILLGGWNKKLDKLESYRSQ